MHFDLLFENLTSPALLFFLLGIIASKLKSDLEIPSTSSKFISLYLLFSIGFKGGQELAHSHFTAEILWTVLLGLLVACIIPFYTFFILKQKLSIENAGAVAATYGSISAVTFVTAVSFLETQNQSFGGHLVAIMALMEAPAIIIGVTLIRMYSPHDDSLPNIRGIVVHSFTNASVLLILGSLLIGWLASDKQAQGIAPFTTDIFMGFLAVFLLDMGIQSGKRLSEFFRGGWFTTLFAIVIPLVNGISVSFLSGFVTDVIGNRFLLSVLAASASYIAVPAAMRIAVPKANPSIFMPMSLAITFPINITIGLPIYYYFVQNF
ncbi:MAG: sodium-dependent bicarbonate transport family permease [Bacteroidales bacterium]